MKYLALAALLLTIFQVCSSQDPTPSSKFQCPPEDGFYADPTNCAKYYHCFNHLAWELNCPPGLYFNTDINVCDFKYNVDCKTDSVKFSQGLEMDDFTCPEESGFFPVMPTACEQDYFVCVANVSYHQNCPGNTFFDPSTKACRTYEDLSCDPTTDSTIAPTTDSTIAPTTDSTIAPTTTPTIRPTSGPFRCPEGQDGSFPFPGNCNKFYVCSNGYAFSMTCPAGLYFNPDANACDYDSVVRCDE